MKVTGWTYWDDPRYESFDGSYERWEEVKNVVAAEMRKRGYKFSGYYHQGGDFGVPIIDDKYLVLISQRSWGRLMVRAYPDEIDNSEGLGYCKWAWGTPVGEKMVVPGEE